MSNLREKFSCGEVSEKMEDTLLYGPRYHVTSTRNEIDEGHISRLEREHDSLKQQLAEAERERDSLKQQLNKANNIIRNLVAESQEPGGQCYECKAFDPGDCFKCYMGEADYYVCIYLKRGEGNA